MTVQDKKQATIRIHTLKLLLIIVLLSFSFRAIKIGLTKRINDDSILYVAMAKAWALENSPNAAYRLYGNLPPLYIAVMVLSEKIGVGAELGGRLFSLFISFLLPIPFFIMAWVLFRNQKLALLAAFLAAIHPTFIKHGVEVLRDGSFFTFMAFGLAFLVLGISRKNIWYWGASGISAAIASLLRKEGIEVFIAVYSFSFIELFLQRKTVVLYLKQRIPAVLCFTILFLAIVIPAQWAVKSRYCTWSVIPYTKLLELKELLMPSKEERNG